MIRILWLADQPGWAYFNRAKHVGGACEGYEHTVVLDLVRNFGQAIELLTEADIIVCPDPRLLPFLAAWYDKIVLNLNAIKIFM